MVWSIEQTYARADEQSLGWLRGNRAPFFHLRPPIVPKELLAGIWGAPRSREEEFKNWVESAALAVEPAMLEDAPLPDKGEFYGQLPERELLLELKWLAEQLGGPLTLYSAETFAGGIEYEWCYEFGPRERVLINAEHPTGHRLHEFSAAGARSQPIGNAFAVLVGTLASMGIITGGGFAPHERGFKWTDYLVKPTGP